MSSGLSFNKNISTEIELSIENKGKKYEDYCRNLYFNGKYTIIEYFNYSLYWVLCNENLTVFYNEMGLYIFDLRERSNK